MMPAWCVTPETTGDRCCCVTTAMQPIMCIVWTHLRQPFLQLDPQSRTGSAHIVGLMVDTDTRHSMTMMLVKTSLRIWGGHRTRMQRYHADADSAVVCAATA